MLHRSYTLSRRASVLLAVVAALVLSRAGVAQQTPTPIDPIAEAALLQLADMPVGWTQEEVGSSSPGGRSLCSDNDEGTSAIGKAEAKFQRSALGPILYHLIATYEPGRAAEIMERQRNAPLPCVTEDVGEDGTVTTTRISAMSFPALGDESLAWRVELSAGVAEIQADFVFIRIGDYITAVFHLQGGLFTVPTVDSERTERFARLAEERLRAVLPPSTSAATSTEDATETPIEDNAPDAPPSGESSPEE